jgi:O-acetyl-ADP-ribose deacetylase (regulator of RNase III)
MVAERIELFRGDITSLAVDIIVNAANPSLTPGGAVGLAIHRAAGPELKAECSTLPGCSPGDAAITRAYRLPAKYVIHAVGASWHGGNQGEVGILANTYRRCFHLASDYQARTIAFPAISCGIYSFPVAVAAEIAIHETMQALRVYQSIQRVTFALFAENVYSGYADVVAARRETDTSPTTDAGQ